MLFLHLGIGIHRGAGLHGILSGRAAGLGRSHRHASHEGRATRRNKQISHFRSPVGNKSPEIMKAGVIGSIRPLKLGVRGVVPPHLAVDAASLANGAVIADGFPDDLGQAIRKIFVIQ